MGFKLWRWSESITTTIKQPCAVGIGWGIRGFRRIWDCWRLGLFVSSTNYGLLQDYFSPLHSYTRRYCTVSEKPRPQIFPPKSFAITLMFCSQGWFMHSLHIFCGLSRAAGSCFFVLICLALTLKKSGESISWPSETVRKLFCTKSINTLLPRSGADGFVLRRKRRSSETGQYNN